MTDNIQRSRKAYLQACQLELVAFKPGNVSVHADGHDMCAEDFILSARLSVGPLTDFSIGLGQRIHAAVAATRESVGCNTNLGIILLAAPLMQAFVCREVKQTLAASLRCVLESSSIEDADWCFRAICLAAPGGLGESGRHDVNATPQVNLLEAMREAAGRDRIAAQYASGYADIFDFALPLLTGHESPDSRAATEDLYVAILARWPDSHVCRKIGRLEAEAVSQRAAILRKQLRNCHASDKRDRLLRQVDQAFKQAGLNPGASADLTVASLLVRRLVSHETDIRVNAKKLTGRPAGLHIFHQPTTNKGEKHVY